MSPAVEIPEIRLGYDATVELEAALQELVVADQEARWVYEELETYWDDLMIRMKDVSSPFARNVGGELRGSEIANAHARLEQVRLRIGTASRPSRGVPPMPKRDSDFGRHGAGVLPELDQILMAYDDVLRMRRWARACHQLWAPNTPSPLEDLGDFEVLIDARPDMVSGMVRAYRIMRPAKTVIAVVCGIAVVVLIAIEYQKLVGP